MCMPNFMILSQAVLQIFCWQGPLWVQCLSQKRGLLQSNIHRTLWKVNHVIYIMYLNCMIDAITLAQVVLQLFCSTRLFYYTKCQSQKREIIPPNIYRILPTVGQDTYTLDTMCLPNFMILSQAVLQIFCWQGPLWVKCLSEKGNNSVKYSQNFTKSWLGHLHHVPNLYDWCHYPSSSGCPGILLTRLL